MSTDFERGRETASRDNHDADTDVSEGRRDFLRGRARGRHLLNAISVVKRES
jgi:hypothetical protein